MRTGRRRPYPATVIFHKHKRRYHSDLHRPRNIHRKPKKVKAKCIFHLVFFERPCSRYGQLKEKERSETEWSGEIRRWSVSGVSVRLVFPQMFRFFEKRSVLSGETRGRRSRAAKADRCPSARYGPFTDLRGEQSLLKNGKHRFSQTGVGS